VTVTKVVLTENFRSGIGTLRSISLGGKAGKLLWGLLFLLGFALPVLVIVRVLTLHVAPDAVSEIRFVTASLEAVVLAELIERSGSTLDVDVITGLANSRILNLFRFQHLLSLSFALSFSGNRLGKGVLENTVKSFGDENLELFLDACIELVLNDEGVDDGFEGRHFESFKYKNFEKVYFLLLLIFWRP